MRVESNFWETGVNVREARWCFEAVDPEFASETTDQDLRHSALIQNQDNVKISLATEKASQVCSRLAIKISLVLFHKQKRGGAFDYASFKTKWGGSDAGWWWQGA